ncbi:hypothetical protein [Salinispora mooreana]|nr:hypothetical protein [Salinispora mooreana]
MKPATDPAVQCLGCGQPWAPKTVDAVLAEAYAELCADLEERTAG